MRSKEPKFQGEYSLINSNIKKITRLLRQILEVRKSQAGQLRLKVSQQNMQSFLETTVMNIRPMADVKDVRLDLNIDAPEMLQSVWFDADKLDKILYNLISNAIKYGREGGYVHVLTAKNGKQALNIIHKEELDIVISDVMMPVMDGIELIHAIKNDANYAQLPVILLTAKTRDEDRNEALLCGADDYITKPFRMSDLAVRVDNIISNRHRIRTKFANQTDYHVEDQHYSDPDQAFVEKAIECVRKHLSDGDYDRETFAADMCISSSTLYNKLRGITGQNVSGFISSIRLKESCRILRERPDISMTELASMVGFNTPKYFSKCFKKEFGMLPSEYAGN